MGLFSRFDVFARGADHGHNSVHLSGALENCELNHHGDLCCGLLWLHGQAPLCIRGILHPCGVGIVQLCQSHDHHPA